MRKVELLAFVCAFALTFSTVALAKTKNEGSFDLAQAASLGSTQLQPGHYKAEWTGTNNGTVNVAVMQHGKTVATAKAELKPLANRPAYNAVTLQTLPNHQNRIQEIDFGNRKDALVLSGAAS